MNIDHYFEGVKSYKLLAKHEVGQNFLVDPDAAKKVVDLLSLEKGDKVLEIGPGAGSLSVFLSESEAEADLVDIDEGLIVKLKGDFEGKENVRPTLGNALKWDMSPYDKIVGNLPYYITSSLLERVLLTASNAKRAVFMVQKEALSRLVAPQGTKDYGPLPILLAYRAKVKREFFVPRSSFSPEPHVDSVVFSLEFRDYENSFLECFYALLTACFLHRRKTILNNLTGFLNGENDVANQALSLASIDPKKRPEQLSIEDFERLAKALEGLPMPLGR